MSGAHRLLRSWSWWRTPVGLVVGIGVTAAAVLVSRSAALVGPMAAIWLPNAVVLAVLLIVSRRPLIIYAITLYTACFATSVLTGTGPIASAASALINGVLMLITAIVLRRDPTWIAGTKERASSWLWFVVAGVLVPFGIGAVAHAALRHLALDTPLTWERLGPIALTYLATNGVAALLIVPAVLRLRPTYLRRRPASGRRAELVLTILLLIALTSVLMVLAQPPLLLLLPIPLVFAAVRHGALGATLASLVVVPVTIACTAHGVGPFAAVALADGAKPVALLWAQLFLALLMAVGIAAVTAPDDVQRGSARLAAETAEDVVALLHTDGHVLDVPDVDAWWKQVHPAFRAGLMAAVAAAERDGTAEALTRMRNDGGTWRWFDLRLRRDGPGGVDAPVLVLGRDVTTAHLRELHLEELNQELMAAAGTDALTGLANRRRLAEVWVASWAAAATAHEPLALLLVDIDHFKDFNDHYGHVRGDAALVAVADAIRSALRRPTDLAARYGGEEFVVLLPHTDTIGAADVAESIRYRIHAAGIGHHTAAAPGAVTVSIGVSTIRPGAVDVDDGSLFEAADAALYRAKRRGRDRIEILLPDAAGRAGFMPPGPGQEP